MIMYRKPQLRFFLVLAAFVAVSLAFSASAQAAKVTSGGRYFIASQNAFIKALFGVQHEFQGGFTADLTSGEVWTLGKIFKAEVTPVPLYKVTAGAVGSASVMSDVAAEAVSLIQEKDTVKKIRNFTPKATVPWGVKKIYGDEKLKSTTGGKDVTVAVLDTGINAEHVDLVNRLADCKDFTRGSVARSTCQDQNGHGTHMAGIIAADGGWDGKGIWGVASETNLLIYKVCRNDGTCWADDVAAGLLYAIQAKANIISLGLGGNDDIFLMKDAVNQAVKKNILIVASAGNDGPLKGSIDWPAAYADVVAVGALDEEGLVPDWSSRGVNDSDYIMESREIEFAAPGVNIESIWSDGGYRFISGTSAAAPHVAGLAAKLWNGSATSTRMLLQRSAQDMGLWGDDTATGFGLPQAPRITATESSSVDSAFFQSASDQVMNVKEEIK